MEEGHEQRATGRRRFLQSTITTAAGRGLGLGPARKMLRAQETSPRPDQGPAHPLRGHRHEPRPHQRPGRGGDAAAAASSSPSSRRSRTSRPPSPSGIPRPGWPAARRRSSRTLAFKLVVSAAIAERARPPGHRGDAPRQGLHVRQAGDDDARAAGGGAPRAGGDAAHLLDPLQRAPREPGHRQGRRAGQGGRHRPGDPDHRPGAAPHEPQDAPGLVLREGALRRHPLRHRLAPVRPVPVLHRLDAGRDRGLPGRQRPSPGASRASRTSAT